MDNPLANGTAKIPGTDVVSFRELSVSALLREFSAGREVPGSGSANALGAAVAACLIASVAAKTHRSREIKYLHVQQTAIDVERRARRMAEQLVALVDEDSAVFAPVIALRRDTGRAGDPVLQDASLRQEVAALKPATEVPLQIAKYAITVAELAITMLESGFAPARGEAYTALTQSIAAVDGAMFVAQLNIRTVRRRIAKLNDPELEADWIQRVLRDLKAIQTHWRDLRLREQLARRALFAETFNEREPQSR